MTSIFSVKLLIEKRLGVLREVEKIWNIVESERASWPEKIIGLISSVEGLYTIGKMNLLGLLSCVAFSSSNHFFEGRTGESVWLSSFRVAMLSGIMLWFFTRDIFAF